MKNLALLMLFLLFSWHVFAQPETNKTADPEVEVIKSDLTKPGLSKPELSKPISPKLILDELRDGLSSLKADFIQYELKEDNSRIDESLGSVWMSAPNKFRWHYLQPMEQLIIADGDKVWVYDEDLEQVTVKPQDNELNPIYVLINGDKSDHYYETKYESSEGAGTWISMRPTKRSDEVKTVWLKIENKQLKTIKLVNHFDQVIVFEFKNIERNAKIPDEMFHFEVPKGVDVISAEALTSSQ